MPRKYAGSTQGLDLATSDDRSFIEAGIPLLTPTLKRGRRVVINREGSSHASNIK